MLDHLRAYREWPRHRRGLGNVVPPDLQSAEDFIAYVERHLGVTAEQREAWERLAETVRDSAEVMEIAYAAVDKTEGRALDRLASLLVVAEVATAAFRRIRPPLEGFYATLDEPQRQALDELVAHGAPYALGPES